MSRLVVLIACSAKKVAGKERVPIRELYQGRLFHASLAYAEARGAEWGVISALHGLLLPADTRAPYDFRMRERGTRHELAHWRETVRLRVLHTFGREGTSYIALLGAEYLPCAPKEAETPLRGLGIGQQLQWLRRETERYAGVAGKGAA